MIPTKENIWLKKDIEEYDDEKCYLICFVNFHGLRKFVCCFVCVYTVYACGGRIGQVGARTGFF